MKSTNTIAKAPVITIGEDKYYEARTFANLIGKSVRTVYSLISLGNKVRKLSAIYICGKPLIPVAELHEFPFTPLGRNSEQRAYHFDENLNKVRVNA